MSESDIKQTPSSANSIFNRIRNFRIHLDASMASISSDSQNESYKTDNIEIPSVIQINESNTINNIFDDTKSINSNKNRSKNNIEIPLTPQILSPDTISSSNVIQYTNEHKKDEKQSPTSFENVFQKLQSFRVSLDNTQSSPLQLQNNNNNTLKPIKTVLQQFQDAFDEYLFVKQN
eukprot:158896_1